jgi:hypothetical protein
LLAGVVICICHFPRMYHVDFLSHLMVGHFKSSISILIDFYFYIHVNIVKSTCPWILYLSPLLFLT